MSGWNLVYRLIIILLLCVLLVWTYLTNQETVLNYVSGKLVPDIRIAWEIGIFGILCLTLFYFMLSSVNFKTQAETLKKYTQQLEHELEIGRVELKGIRLEFSKEILHLESFIVILSDMAKQLSSVLDIDTLLKVLLKRSADLLGSRKCAIFKVDAKANKLICVDSIGYDNSVKDLSLKIDEESGQIGYSAKIGAFVSRNLMIYQDPARKYILNNDKLETSYCQPIVHNFRTFAVICVGDASESLTHEQAMHFLSILANFGAVALTNTELVDKIREQSIRDSLTWLYNHQYFQNRMDMLLEQAKKENRALGFIIMDIDHFKQLNDTHGHQAGDFVLKKIAELLRSELSGDDVIARYGGEEFVVILPRKDANLCYEAAERVRQKIEASRFNFDGKNLSITASAGVSIFDPAGDKKMGKDKIIKLADNALYEAKRGGRNKVILDKA